MKIKHNQKHFSSIKDNSWVEGSRSNQGTRITSYKNITIGSTGNSLKHDITTMPFNIIT